MNAFEGEVQAGSVDVGSGCGEKDGKGLYFTRFSFWVCGEDERSRRDKRLTQRREFSVFLAVKRNRCARGDCVLSKTRQVVLSAKGLACKTYIRVADIPVQKYRTFPPLPRCRASPCRRREFEQVPNPYTQSPRLRGQLNPTPITI